MPIATTATSPTTGPVEVSTMTSSSVCADRVHGDPQPEVDAGVALDGRADGAEALAEDSLRAGPGTASRTVTSAPMRAGTRGDLCADEARADDDDPASRAEREAQPVGVGLGPQVWIRSPCGAGDPARPPAGGDSTESAGEGGPVGEQHPAGRGVDARRRGGGPHVDVVRVGPDLREQPEAGLVLVGEVLLGQRRPLVGQVRLVAHDGDGAVVPPAPQGPGGHGRGLSPADDDDPPGAHGATTGASVLTLTTPSSPTCTAYVGWQPSWSSGSPVAGSNFHW